MKIEVNVDGKTFVMDNDHDVINAGSALIELKTNSGTNSAPTISIHINGDSTSENKKEVSGERNSNEAGAEKLPSSSGNADQMDEMSVKEYIRKFIKCAQTMREMQSLISDQLLHFKELLAKQEELKQGTSSDSELKTPMMAGNLQQETSSDSELKNPMMYGNSAKPPEEPENNNENQAEGPVPASDKSIKLVPLAQKMLLLEEVDRNIREFIFLSSKNLWADIVNMVKTLKNSSIQAERGQDRKNVKIISITVPGDVDGLKFSQKKPRLVDGKWLYQLILNKKTEDEGTTAEEGPTASGTETKAACALNAKIIYQVNGAVGKQIKLGERPFGGVPFLVKPSGTVSFDPNLLKIKNLKGFNINPKHRLKVVNPGTGVVNQKPLNEPKESQNRSEDLQGNTDPVVDAPVVDATKGCEKCKNGSEEHPCCCEDDEVPRPVSE